MALAMRTKYTKIAYGLLQQDKTAGIAAPLQIDKSVPQDQATNANENDDGGLSTISSNGGEGGGINNPNITPMTLAYTLNGIPHFSSGVIDTNTNRRFSRTSDPARRVTYYADGEPRYGSVPQPIGGGSGTCSGGSDNTGKTVCTQDVGVAAYPTMTSSTMKGLGPVGTPLILVDDSDIYWQIQECGSPQVWVVHASLLRFCPAPCKAAVTPRVIQRDSKAVCTTQASVPKYAGRDDRTPATIGQFAMESFLVRDDTRSRWQVRECTGRPGGGRTFFIDSAFLQGCGATGCL